MPVAFELGETLDAFDGEQITLGAIDEQSRAIFETYFNPPGALALMIPFFFERHRSLMDAYRRLVLFGALIGSEPNGQVTPRADLVSGQAFDWTLGTLDQENIRFALRVLLELGQHAGARRAVLPTRPGVELPVDPRSIDELCRCLRDRPLRTRDLLVNTAHPQGGNSMMADGARHAARQVVDGSYRVVGCDNVFVADASLFPTSITVNPQWTIMAMSSLAARAVLEATR
jgi:choline dehydrogenase-like flavoprotein